MNKFIEENLVSVSVLVGISIILTSIYFFGREPEIGNDLIAPEHLLEVSQDRIIEAKEIDWVVQKEDGTFENKGKIVAYDYITDKKVEGEFIWHKGDYTNLKKVDGKIRAYIGDKFYKEGKDVYRIQHGATTTIEAFETQTTFGALGAEDPVYSGAGDGRVYTNTGYGAAGNSWDNMHDSTSGHSNYSATGDILVRTTQVDGAGTHLVRGFLPIDLSGLGSITVGSATMNLYIHATVNTISDNYDYVALVGVTTQASPTSLTGADFIDCGSVDSPDVGSDNFDLSSVSTSQYNVLDFNDTGIGWIEDAAGVGYLLIGIRTGWDIADVSPGAGSSENQGSIDIQYSENTDGDKDPYLELTLVTDTCTISTTGRHGMNLQDHCTTTASVYSAFGLECYNQSGGGWTIAEGVEVRVASSTGCIPNVRDTAVFSIQPSQ